MKILKFLINYLMNNGNFKELSPIIKLLSDNSFDIKRALSQIDFQKLMPFIMKLFSSQNKSPEENISSGQNVGLEPVVNIADKDIIYTLNKYLSA